MAQDRSRYTVRDARNQESRQTAGRHQDAWTDDDLTFLRENFTTSAEMVLVAELLGRTVEACRQKYYVGTAGTAGTKKADTRTPSQRRWDQGFTSFDDLEW